MAATQGAPKDIAVIVTGAARGMGRAMTLALASAGVRVAAADLASSRDAMQEVLDTARKQGVQDKIIPLECDITRWQDCAAAVRTAGDRFGAVHGIVNNAGIAVTDEELASGRARRRRFYEHDADGWRRVIDTNVNGSFQMAKAIAPALVAQGWGRIVDRHDELHHHASSMGFSPYGPSKAALEAATVVWSKDLANTGVTVNALVARRRRQHAHGSARRNAGSLKARAARRHDGADRMAHVGRLRRRHRAPLCREPVGPCPRPAGSRGESRRACGIWSRGQSGASAERVTPESRALRTAAVEASRRLEMTWRGFNLRPKR